MSREPLMGLFPMGVPQMGGGMVVMEVLVMRSKVVGISRLLSVSSNLGPLRVLLLISIFLAAPVMAQQSCSQCQSAYGSCMDQVNATYNTCKAFADQRYNQCKQDAQAWFQSCIDQCGTSGNGSMCGRACEASYGGNLVGCDQQYQGTMMGCQSGLDGGTGGCMAAINACQQGPPPCTP